MSVYINVNAVHGNNTNFLGITDGETAVIAGLAAVIALLIALGVFATAPEILLGILAILAVYGVLYTIHNIGTALSNVYSGITNGLDKIGIKNPFVSNIIIAVIITIVICLLFYGGYYIYENI